MENDISKQLFSFIKSSPTAAHTAANMARGLSEQGYVRLLPWEKWELEPGGKYFAVYGTTSIIALQMPKHDFRSFLIIGAHGDSPCFKIKSDMLSDGKYARLNTEPYGGMNLNLWYDRPLSAAGQVVVKTAQGAEVKLINIKKDLFIIPSLAIHMNREVNNGIKVNPQQDMLPLYGMGDKDFMSLVAAEAGVEAENILSHELYLYNRQEGSFVGESQELIACPKLDDLQCAFSAYRAFIASQNDRHVRVMAIFDNEEIGSMTKQGAYSTILSDMLRRVSNAYGKDIDGHMAAVSGSFIVSADNGHAVHPNAPDRSDPVNRCYPNGGVVIKHSPNYATDAVSDGMMKLICERAGVPTQDYYNRSDIRGGSTIGNIVGVHTSAYTVDMGLAQLGMHSPYETGGADDTMYLYRAMEAFYSSSFSVTADGLQLGGELGKNNSAQPPGRVKAEGSNDIFSSTAGGPQGREKSDESQRPGSWQDILSNG